MPSLLGGQTGNQSRGSSGLLAGSARSVVEVQSTTRLINPPRFAFTLPTIFADGASLIAVSSTGTLASLVSLAGNALIGLSSAGALAAPVKLDGLGAILLAGSGVLAVAVKLDGFATVQLTGAGSATVPVRLTGSALIPLTAYGTIQTISGQVIIVENLFYRQNRLAHSEIFRR